MSVDEKGTGALSLMSILKSLGINQPSVSSAPYTKTNTQKIKSMHGTNTAQKTKNRKKNKIARASRQKNRR